MILKCKTCQKNFSFSVSEQKLLEKFELDLIPDKCFKCNNREKLSFCGFINFKKTKSSLSNTNLISCYSENNKFPIYSIQEWWSDLHNPLEFSEDFELTHNFFDTLRKLSNKVPRMANSVVNCENSNFSNYAGNSKNVYYSNIVYGYCENIFYSNSISDKCLNLCDCSRVYKSSYCYECIQCSNIHYSAYLLKCLNSRDCFFSYNLIGCSNCIFCTNLRNKNYYVFNKKVTKEEFEIYKNKFINGSYLQNSKNIENWHKIIQSAPTINTTQTNCENCTGNALLNSGNSQNCFHAINLSDCINCMDISAVKPIHNALNAVSSGIGELLYNVVRCGNHCYFLRNCSNCRACSYLDYCIDCVDSKNCFACIGLKKNEYCIFNKQYTKEDYEYTKNKIIEKLKYENIWGLFFPLDLSSYEYNDSIAVNWFPLAKEQAEELGFKWHEVINNDTNYSTDLISDNINDCDPNISEVTHSHNGKKFKIIREEIELLKILNQPIHRISPLERFANRFRLIEQIDYFDDICTKCKSPLQHSFIETRTIYCNSCYQETLR